MVRGEAGAGIGVRRRPTLIFWPRIAAVPDATKRPPARQTCGRALRSDPQVDHDVTDSIVAVASACTPAMSSGVSPTVMKS
jgi:hypothetical protein